MLKKKLYFNFTGSNMIKHVPLLTSKLDRDVLPDISS